MLTPAQMATVKADILATPELNAFPNTADGAFAIAALYNQLASPAFVVWRSNVSTPDIRAALIWSEYDGLTISKQNAFGFLCSNGTVNAALTNVRAGISSIFGGAQQSGNLAAMLAIAKRDATRIETLLASGAGTSGTPATMGFEGVVSYQDVQSARNS
jgi:hypothetical protein